MTTRSPVSGALLVAGTTSDAGKSMVVAGLCRLLARKGIRVAPFKAQNMSNNSAVTVEGGEIGRAQAMQARAAGLEPSVRFNPILLKPGSDTTSQLVIRGQVAGSVTAAEYWSAPQPAGRLSCMDELSHCETEFDAVICEGAGSPAEINLRATDLVNMGLARAANLPVVVVGDIDRGGLLAHLFGTVAVLEPDDQALIAGFIVNKFRGDVALLEPGLRQLAELTGRPTYGVLPYADDLWLDAEDSRVGTGPPRPGHAATAARRPVAAGRGAAAAPDLQLHRRRGAGLRTRRAGALGRPNPPTWPMPTWSCCRAPSPPSPTWAGCASAAWTEAIAAHAASGRAGAGHLRWLSDAVPVDRRPDRKPVGPQSRRWGCWTPTSCSRADKVLRRWRGSLRGYEIHHGRVARCAEASWFEVDRMPQGYWQRGQVFGTHWHGLFDNDDFRRRVVDRRVAAAAGPADSWSPTTSMSRRDAMLNSI